MTNDPFAGLMSLSDAAKRWRRDDSTLRQAIRRGKFKVGFDVKLFGKQWIITEAALFREYGKPES